MAHQSATMDLAVEVSKAIEPKLNQILENQRDHYENIIQDLTYQLHLATNRANEAEQKIRNFEAWLELASRESSVANRKALVMQMGETSPLKEIEAERDEAKQRAEALEVKLERLRLKRSGRMSNGSRRDSFVPLKESVC